jgi:hypothetical protein
MRFTESQGRTEEPPVRPHRSTRSSAPPPHASWYSNGFIITTEEEEKKLTRLEKRLVAHVDFDDQSLQVLGFHTDIYLGAILQWSVGKHAQGIRLGNSHDHGAYP